MEWMFGFLCNDDAIILVTQIDIPYTTVYVNDTCVAIPKDKAKKWFSATSTVYIISYDLVRK